MIRPVVLLLALAPLAARAAEGDDPFERNVNFAVGAGIGSAYGVVGAHAELILFGHVAPYVGGGLFGFAAGLRFFGGRSEGLMLSLNYGSLSSSCCTSPNTIEGETTSDRLFGATLGWRWRYSRGLFFEAAAGAVHDRSHDFGVLAAAGPNPCGNSSQQYDCWSASWVPDIALAGGFSF
jgi:hypothetical protein